MSDLRTSTDPLGEALQFLRMSGVFYCRSEFGAPWGIALPPLPDRMMFHVVTSGQAWLEVHGAEPSRLLPGDVALVPHGKGHRLLSEPGAPTAKLFDIPREPVSRSYEILRHGGGGATTTMLCGVVGFDNSAAKDLVQMLPPVIRAGASNSSELEWIESTLRFVTAEAQDLRAGGEAVITRLADVFVFQAIRSWVARDSSRSGWFGALRDKQIGRAIAVIHNDPMRKWTMASLASTVGMSRSAFAARFTQIVGEPAMHYATRRKMQAAQMKIKEDDSSLSELADHLGYQSAAAFSRAFKRFTGVSPGTIRKNGKLIAEKPAENGRRINHFLHHAHSDGRKDKQLRRTVIADAARLVHSG